MTIVYIPILNATEGDLYMSMGDPMVPMYTWLSENVGNFYSENDFQYYWRGVNWMISNIVTTHIGVQFSDDVPIETITLFKLRWL